MKPLTSSTHPAGALTRTADGSLRQHGDINPELNESPSGEFTDLQSGDVSAATRELIRGMSMDQPTGLSAKRPDIGTE